MKNNNNKNFLKSSSFTLIELIIVLAIISILVTILIATIKPTEIFKKARDNKRIADLKNIEKTIDLLYSTYPNFNELNYASTNIVYISLKDDSPTCSSYISQLPSLPPGYQYRCSANPQNIDGTGWIPIPFKNFDIINLANLPIDPINKPPYYYTFVVGGSYKLSAKPEINYDFAINDGGIEPILYEVGSNKKLSTFQSGLVLYLPFDEGTGTIAYDLSGFGNNGTLVNGPAWTTGKVGSALSFDGVDDYVSTSVNINQSVMPTLTFEAWAYPTSIPSRRELMSHDDGGYDRTIGLESDGMWHVFTGSGLWKPTSVDLNKWQHIVVIFTPSNLLFYKNGIRYSYGTTPTYGSSVYPMNIGRNPGFGEYFPGLIDDVRVYNRALSDSEIKALYDATK
jgi:prepilin-type N-terminal cleavage/methylation domain-containing protein